MINVHEEVCPAARNVPKVPKVPILNAEVTLYARQDSRTLRRSARFSRTRERSLPVRARYISNRDVNHSIEPLYTRVHARNSFERKALGFRLRSRDTARGILRSPARLSVIRMRAALSGGTSLKSHWCCSGISCLTRRIINP